MTGYHKLPRHSEEWNDEAITGNQYLLRYRIVLLLWLQW